MGKYNNYIATLQRALEARKINENNTNTEQDQQHADLAMVKPDITPARSGKISHKATNKVTTDQFEAEYAAFIAKLKAETKAQENVQAAMNYQDTPAEETKVEESTSVVEETKVEEAKVEEPVVKSTRKKKAKAVEAIIADISASNI